MHNQFSSRNLKAVSAALLLFVYLVLALSTSSIRYLETVQRVTVQQVFDQTVFGSTSSDGLAALGFLLLFVAVAFRTRLVRVVAVATFGAGIVALLGGYEQVLQVAGLTTLPILGSLLLVGTITRRQRAMPGKERALGLLALIEPDWKRVAVAFLAIVIVLEASALARWVVYPIAPSQIYGDESWKPAELESALFHAFGLLSPVMLVLLTFSFLFKDFIRGLFLKSGTEKIIEKEPTRKLDGNKDRKGFESSTTSSKFENTAWEVPHGGTSPMLVSQSTKVSKILHIPPLAVLAAAMLISIGVTLYPHLPGINQSGTGISTDEQAYINWLAELRALESQGFAITSPEMISKIFTTTSDRPLSILLMMAISDLTGQPDKDVVRFLPAALAPALVLASYCFVRYGYRFDEPEKNVRRNTEVVAGIVAMAAALSPQIVVGLYGGFLANWLALIPGFLAILFAVRISDEIGKSRNEKISSKRLAIHALCFFATLTLAMLFHVYTWGFVILVSLLFAFFSHYSMRKSRSATKREALMMSAILIGIIVGSIVTDVAKSSYFSVGSGLEADSFLAGSNFELGNYNARWETLGFTLEAYVGGFLSHPAVTLLALLWVFKASYSRGFDRIIFSMLIVLAIPLLFGTTVIQARLLYVVPLFIPAVLAFYNVRAETALASRVAIVAIILSLATYSLRAMANLYLVLPEGYEIDKPFLVH